MTRKSAIEQYEKHLLCNKKYYFPELDIERKQAVTFIFRYVVEELLEFSPEEAYGKLNKACLDESGLSFLLKQYMNIPKDINIYNDTDYLLSQIYPDLYRYDPYEKTVTLYNKILKGEISKFPKNYFSTEIGKNKAEYLLLYIIDKNLSLKKNTAIFDLYELFSDDKKINKKLKEWKIKKLQEQLYLNALTYLHEALPRNQKNDFLYFYFSFLQSYADVHLPQTKK